MSPDDPTSSRQRRRIARDGAAALRSRPGWDPARFAAERAEDRLRSEERVAAADAMAAATASCERCQALRRDLGDDSALCAEHFGALLGAGPPRPGSQ